METSIEDLLKNNCIKELDYAPHCVNPLTVADKSKLRLVIDLRHVNNYEVKKKFKYENLKTVSELFEQDDHFVTFDLKSGYHHIPIHESHQKYLGFSWVFNGRRRFFQFNSSIRLKQCLFRFHQSFTTIGQKMAFPRNQVYFVS